MNGKIEAHHPDTADSPERVDDIRAGGRDELIGVKAYLNAACSSGSRS